MATLGWEYPAGWQWLNGASFYVEVIVMRNIVQFRFILLAIVIALSGCYTVERSEELTEEAEITDVIYTPSAHGTGSGMGISTSGSMVITTNNVSIPEVYATVFKCPHGKFIVKRKDIWERAKVGMKVTIRYREVYRISSNSRRLVKYDFIDFDELK